MNGPEKTEEDKYVKAVAIQLNCWALKFKHEGIKGAPDRMVIVPMEYNKKPFFIEFKRPDGKGEVSPHQWDFIEQLEEFGFTCFICLTCEEALKVTWKYLNGT